MRPTKIVFAILIATVLGIALFMSCTKEATPGTVVPSGKQSVAVYLNDDPAFNFQKVMIDIRYVEVKVDTGRVQHDDDYYDNDHDGDKKDKDKDKDHHDNDKDHHEGDSYGKWDTLSITPRVYDLLKLKNGVDTLIARGNTNIGKITKVRITLGNQNTVWTDSVHSFPLSLCDNAPYAYAKVKSNNVEILPNGQVTIRLDFDVARSIEYENGSYCLKPKLKSYSHKTTGKIEGKVKPRGAKALIKVFNATDTAYAIPEEDGEYKIKGLKPADYSVLYKATAPYKDTTITNVKVTAGNETKVPLITLHQ